jgi:hypothetical protein
MVKGMAPALARTMSMAMAMTLVLVATVATEVATEAVMWTLTDVVTVETGERFSDHFSWEVTGL